jgi:hypothetical protein
MSQENVEIVKRFIAPPGTDYTDLFGDELAWGARKDAVEPLVASDFEGAFVAGSQRLRFIGVDGMRQGYLEWLTPMGELLRRDRERSRR